MTNPARYWRGIVRSSLLRFQPTSEKGSDLQLEAYLAAEFQQAKLTLVKKECDRTTSDEAEATRLALFVLGVGLLTFGHLDVLEDILTNMPPKQHPARSLWHSVEALIPLPENMSPDSNPIAILDWVRREKADLCWSDEQGRFVSS